MNVQRFVSKYDLWDDSVVSLQARYEGLTGDARLRAKALQNYSCQGNIVKVKVRVFNSRGERLMFRHWDNDRESSTTEDTYAIMIIRHGFVEGCRSDAVGIPSGQTLDEPIYLLAAASVVEGVYKAHEREPNNPNVIFTIANGIDIQLLDKRSPRDVTRFFKEQCNMFSTIFAKHSFKECLNIMDDIEAAWLAFRKSDKKRKKNKVATTTMPKTKQMQMVMLEARRSLRRSARRRATKSYTATS